MLTRSEQFILGIIIAGALALWFVYHQEQGRDYIASLAIKAEMKKHGIDIAYCGWDDRCWFVRDGKKIYMVTK